MGEAMSKRFKSEADEMEERYFQNPYAEYNSAQPPVDLFDASGKISAAFEGRLTAKIHDLVAQMEEGLKTADPHDYSGYTGWTGIGLLYVQLHRVQGEPGQLQRALDHAKRSLRGLSGRRVSFLCGDAGPLALGAVVHHKLGNADDSRECVRQLLELKSSVVALESDVPDEVLYGRAGFLFALLYVRAELGEEAVPAGVIDEVRLALVESGKALAVTERRAERCPLLYQWHGKQYVGAAHGLAGIYYMLMQPGAGMNKEASAELVKPSVDYVRRKRFRSGNFPSSLSNESDRLVHWCHGAPGVVHALLQAHRAFGDEKYLRDALECGEVVWQRGLLRKGYGLCHGVAGNAYTFLALYRATGEHGHLYRACRFAEWCLDYGKHGCRIPDRPFSLFEGMAGTIHFLVDMLRPDTSRFPAFEL
ncbi:lanC-like protein 2 isoform X1 [Petromyzon marinus]|uniref:lanC-like protein 2 isoform X1 n=2 Tax=Petromyzon marinus TaxID=7757 RepID=UPI003F6EF9BD